MLECADDFLLVFTENQSTHTFVFFLEIMFYHK